MQKDGMGGKVQGTVASVRNLGGAYRYTIVSDGVISVESEGRFALRDSVEAARDGEVWRLSLLAGKDGEYDKPASKMMRGLSLAKRSKLLQAGRLSGNDNLDSVAKRMVPKMVRPAKVLLRAAISGAPIVARFHGDGDGASGAIALYKALAKVQDDLQCSFDIKWVSNRGISYSMDSFYYDTMHFRNYESIEKPVVCIIDFGTTEESNEAIRAARGSLDFVWLDHHPVMEGFDAKGIGSYINPVNFKGTSDFAAGFLAGIFSQLIADAHVEELKEASLISDFSAFADHKNYEASRYATILDFVTGIKDSTHYLDGPLTPSYLLKLITDKEKAASVYNDANRMIEDAIKIGMEKARSYKRGDGIAVNVIDFVHIADKYGGYLLPGRYSSKVQGRLDSQHEHGAITIVNFRNVISVRVSKRISERIGLPGMIDKLKGSTDLIVSGGGHREASSMISTEGSSELVIKLLLKELLA